MTNYLCRPMQIIYNQDKKFYDEYPDCLQNLMSSHTHCNANYCISDNNSILHISNKFGSLNVACNKYDAYIYGFRISSKYRSLGYGSLMLSYLEEYVKNKGYKYITGDVSCVDDIDEVHKFYKKNGFQIDTKCNYYYLFKSLE